MTIVLLVFGILLSPSDAFAWGPAAHLHFANEVIRFAFLLPPSIQTLLTQYRLDFLYGCIAADIIIGKGYVEYIHNCHNFDVGMRIFNQAKDPTEKAFMLGYLSHLASDTVSHNLFVPYQNLLHIDHLRFRHAYWEIRFDQYFLEHLSAQVKEVVSGKNTHNHDKMLDQALKGTIFSFRTNKFLFSGMLAIQKLKKWRLLVQRVNHLSRHQFTQEQAGEHIRLSVSAIIHLFTEWEKSCVYNVDPTGTTTLKETKYTRRALRKLHRRRKLTRKSHEEECQKFRDHVYQLYFHSFTFEHERFDPALQIAG